MTLFTDLPVSYIFQPITMRSCRSSIFCLSEMNCCYDSEALPAVSSVTQSHCTVSLTKWGGRLGLSHWPAVMWVSRFEMLLLRQNGNQLPRAANTHANLADVTC